MRAFPVLVGVSLLLSACATAPPPGVVPRSQEPSPPPPTVTWVSEAPVHLTLGTSTDLSGTRGLAKAVVTVDRLIPDGVDAPDGFATPRTLRSELRDADFTRRFFGIWLSPQTSEPKLRQSLLGTALPRP